MKHSTKLSKSLCLLVCLFMGSVFTAVAADFMVDSICYNIIGDNEVEVTRRDVKYSGEVIIPATVVNEGITYQVIRIGNSAFYSCPDLTMVDIPEGVTSINDYAFYFCTSLEVLELPNSLERIGIMSLHNCSSLTSLYIPRNLTEIGRNALGGCSSITNYMCSGMNPYFKTVGGVLFTKDMTQIVAYPPAATATTYDIPSTVTTIWQRTFNYANNLTEITIPEGVTWVGPGAFMECDGIVSLDFPNGVQHIGASGFCGCDNLISVHLPASLDTITNSMVSELTALTELTIPRNVKFIDNFAFTESTGIVSIIFEEGSCLQAIGDRVFEKCTSLEYFDMPNTVTSIGAQIFGYCSSLKHVHLSDNLTSMGNSTFWECTSLLEGEVPGGLTKIHNLFIKCTSLKRARIGDRNSTPGTTTLQNACISTCPQLEYLELGNNIDSLADLSITGVGNLKVVVCWPLAPPKCHYYWDAFSPSPQSLDAVLYVPKASLEAYTVANEWKKFKTIVPIDDLGDVNGDSAVNMDDLTALINILLTADIAARDLPLADTNLDGAIGMDDLTTLINILLTGN